jgi:hypothetical protein
MHSHSGIARLDRMKKASTWPNYDLFNSFPSGHFNFILPVASDACHGPPKRGIFVGCILGWPEGDGRFIIGRFGSVGLFLHLDA